jgi:hypothetical protein
MKERKETRGRKKKVRKENTQKKRKKIKMLLSSF